MLLILNCLPFTLGGLKIRYFFCTSNSNPLEGLQDSQLDAPIAELINNFLSAFWRVCFHLDLAFV